MTHSSSITDIVASEKILLSSFSDLAKQRGDHLTVAVVGASGGIGQALVEQLDAMAFVENMYTLSRNPLQSGLSGSTVDDIVSDGCITNRYALAMDYQDEASIRSAVSQINHPVDIVIVATGLLHHASDNGDIKPEKTYQQLGHESFMQNMLVNALGPSLVAKHILPKMRKKQKNIIAILSARVGSISDNTLGGWYAYRSSKAAVNMMIKTFSVELRRRQPDTIIVGLHPGTVDTELSKPFQRNVKPEKLFTATFSARCLLAVINQLGHGDSGGCFAWDGKRIPE